MEDRRAHDRLDQLDKFIDQYGTDLKQHALDILRIEKSVKENTDLTRSIEINTSEIVMIMRGSKGVMMIIMTLAKIGIAIAALYALWQEFMVYIRGQ